MLILLCNVPQEIYLGIPLEIMRILIPTMVSISIFIFGFLINGIIKKSNKRRILKSQLKALITWGELMKTPILKQISHNRQCRYLLHNRNEFHPETLSIIANPASKINEFHIKDLFDTIVINTHKSMPDSSEILYKYIANMEYLARVENEITTKYKEYANKKIELLNAGNKTFKEMTIYMYSNEGTLPDDLYREKYYEIKWRYANTHPSTAFDLADIIPEFIDPLVTLCNKAAQSTNIIFYKELLTITMSFKHTVISSKSLDEHYRDQIDSHSTRLLSFWRKFNSLLEEMKKLKTKTTLRII